MRSTRNRMKPGWIFLAGLFPVILGFIFFRSWRVHHPTTVNAVTKASIAQALEIPVTDNVFPSELEVSNGLRKNKLMARYTLDLMLQHKMEKLYRQYRPDYGAFVAVDASTGAILSLLSYTREPKGIGNLSLKATFPAASIFKVVTAAAALDSRKAQPSTVVAYTGSNHTLYRRNLTENGNPRWARHVTLREAFARSINTVFAKIGLYFLKPNDLHEYAKRFQFNQVINADLPVQPGTFFLDIEDKQKVAEAASGFTRMAQMSPLQGALMAAAVVNDGLMMEPYIVDSLHSANGKAVYRATQKPLGPVMDKESAYSLRTMMTETVIRGTSQKSFRDLLRKKASRDIEMGGKTGHLTGLSPKGNYDWFIGYATDGERKIAVAALTINEDTWRVKASYVARQFFEGYFKGLKKSIHRAE